MKLRRVVSIHICAFTRTHQRADRGSCSTVKFQSILPVRFTTSDKLVLTHKQNCNFVDAYRVATFAISNNIQGKSNRVRDTYG